MDEAQGISDSRFLISDLGNGFDPVISQEEISMGLCP